MQGVIFDIKEFALNDGFGIRTTVFLKGCPLRCIWCHNPEGLSASPELFVKSNGCLDCGLCRRGCSHEECKPYGRCIHICPKNLVSICGERWEASALADKLLASKDTLNALGGGITLSGGEPLLQADFCCELLDCLDGKLHRCIETSGYAPTEDFDKVVRRTDFVIMDVKLADPKAHKQYTGRDNGLILKNLEHLRGSGIPHLFRVPLIPGITDTEENLLAISALVGSDRVELLPYNTLAPAKYKNVGREFLFNHDAQPTEPDVRIFKNAILKKR